MNDEFRNQDDNILTFWSDIGCPWATLCLDQLRQTALRQGIELVIDHRAYPLELFNSCPTPKTLVDSEVVVIAGLRPELEWHVWSAPLDTYPVTMLPALEAVRAAKDPAIGGFRGSAELDWALRRAFYVDHRCISIPSVILETADACELVNTGALAEAMSTGAARSSIYRDWKLGAGDSVQGSPHIFVGPNISTHNPGVDYRWTGMPALPAGYGPQGGTGFPVIDSYNGEWAKDLLVELSKLHS